MPVLLDPNASNKVNFMIESMANLKEYQQELKNPLKNARQPIGSKSRPKA
jgi:hypothetical protein